MDQRNPDRNPDKDALDLELDAVLAKFTTAEPRSRLEERILANLRIEQKRAAERSWWRWPAATALAAVIALTVFGAWRSRKPVQNVTALHPPATVLSNTHHGTQVANNSERGSIPLRELSTLGELSRRRLKPRSPKLDQFPSPQPLSEQEKMLTEYVAGHHQQAILVARARMAELKKDWQEEMEEASATSNRPASESLVIQQENR
jgi:hypothetical protein